MALDDNFEVLYRVSKSRNAEWCFTEKIDTFNSDETHKMQAYMLTDEKDALYFSRSKRFGICSNFMKYNKYE